MCWFTPKSRRDASYSSWYSSSSISSCVEEYDEDEHSRQKWLEQYKSSMAIATQVRKQKTWPWPNAANIKFPLLTIAGINFHAKAYPALVPNTNIVTGQVVGRDENGDKKVVAERISMFMSHQVMNIMTEWEEDMDRMLITLPYTGCEFKKTYYDSEEGRNVSEHVFAKDLVINYYAKTIEGATVKTQIIEQTPNEILSYQRTMYELEDGTNVRHYRNIELKGDAQPRNDTITQVQDEASGIKPPARDTEDAPRVMLEQHRFLDLDEDDYKEPYIVTVDNETEEVLRIVARFEIEDVKYNNMGEISKIIPIEHFTKYDFIPNPAGGIYGIGFGSLLTPLNESVNALINQTIDAGTLKTMNPGLISRNLRMKGGSLKFRPNEWKQVNATGADIQKGIFPLPIGEPSRVLVDLMQYLISYGERISSSTDLQVGENPGQNQKASTTIIVQENGLRVFTAIYKRIRKALGREFKKLYKLNATYLDPETYFTVIDPTTEEMQQMSVEQTDFTLEGMDVVPSADPQFVTPSQKLARVEMLMALREKGVGLNSFEVDKRVLEALEEKDIDKLLIPEEERQAPPDPDMEKIRLEATMHDDDEEERAFRRELDIAKLQLDAAEKEKKLNIESLKAHATFIKQGADSARDAKKIANDKEKANNAGAKSS